MRQVGSQCTEGPLTVDGESSYLFPVPLVSVRFGSISSTTKMAMLGGLW